MEYKVYINIDLLGHKCVYIDKYKNGKEIKKFKQICKVRNETKTRNLLLKMIDENGVLFTYKVKEKNKYCENEIKLPNEIDDDRIIKIKDYFYNENSLHILYKYIEGEDLLDMIHDSFLEEKELKVIIKKMAECVKLCHDKEIAHLDIKCENYIVTNRVPLELKLVDFEMARQGSGFKRKLEGTVYYMAPEFLECGKYSTKSDIWSLGAVAYFLYGNEFASTKIKKNRKFVNWSFELKQRKRECSSNFASFLQKTLNFSDRYRINIDQVLSDPWLNEQIV